MTARSRIAAPLAVALTAIAVYANSLLNGFALDDVFIVQNNARVHQLAHQGAIWLTPYWPGYGTQLGLYRPLTIFSFALEWAVGGGAPWVFHGVNVLLHALVSVLLFALLARLAPRGAALAGALLFAVHPLHTEAVANIVGQAELLAAAAVVGACALHARRPPEVVAVGRMRAAAIVVLYTLGMLAKEGAIVLPGLLVALDAAQGRLGRSRTAVTRYVRAAAPLIGLLLIVVVAYLGLRVHVVGSIGGVDAAPNLPFLRQEHRLASALRAWPEYIRLLFFPIDLSSDYSPGVILPVAGLSPMALLGAFILLATAGLALMTPVRTALGLPAAWFLIAVFPVSNLLLPIGVLVAERILYLPSVAPSLVLAYAWCHASVHLPPAGRRTGLAAVAAALLLCAGRSALRNPDWEDTPAVWDALVRDHPESYRAQWINGVRMLADGRKDLAARYWELAYRIWPDDPELLNQLAAHYIDTGDYDRSIALLERSHAIRPWVWRTQVLLAYSDVATARFDDALAAIDRAERLEADAAMVHALRAQAYEGLDRLPEAVREWSAALAVPNGNQWTLYAALARDFARLGRTGDALEAVERARARTTAPVALRELDSLASAIGRGCYHVDPPGPAVRGRAGVTSCDEPLAHWGVIVPDPQPDFAKDLQNANALPLSRTGAATGDAGSMHYQ